MLNNMMPHYMEDHAEMMKSGNEEDKKIWFERFNKGWDDAQEIDL
jgi:hypothetical protein